MPEIRDISERELEAILAYLEDKREGDNPSVLVGGWVVYAYNPYEKSRDVDLVLSAKRRTRLLHWLRRRGYRDYTKTEAGWQGATKRFPDVAGPEKTMVVDVAGYDEEQHFEGRNQRLDFDLVRDHHVVRRVAGHEVRVPTRSLMVLYKAKAGYDRRWRLDHDASHDADWEQDKLVKDRSDILALLDSDPDGPDWEVGFLGEQLERLPFLKEVLAAAAHDGRAVERYARLTGAQAKQRMGAFLDLTA